MSINITYIATIHKKIHLNKLIRNWNEFLRKLITLVAY